ncbi:ROK family transcriptional regulator [Nocardioides fonticola]|uniref:ROK family transcriptional regulator n=1 Tax=Nocardioides fonticola TaxID=450363 RepID=A0ABP7XML9_9ACTN
MAQMTAVERTRLPAGPTPGALFDLVRSGRAVTRSALGTATGLSRTAVSARLDLLLAAGLLTLGEQVTTTGGRPSESLRVAAEAGTVLALAIGRSRHQVGLYDLDGTEIASDAALHRAGSSAPDLMPDVVGLAVALQAAHPGPPLLAVGMSLPGAVDTEALTSVGSPVIPGWDGVPLRPFLEPLGEVPVWLGNDAEALAHAELLGRPDLRDALVIKASTGIGLAVLADGRLVRGHDGAAGELGHCRVPAGADKVCRCGATGCLETVAGGWALIGERTDGLDHVRELVALARDGETEARAAIRRAGQHLGEVLAVAVNLLNPEAVVLGGDLSMAFDPLAGGVKETLYPRTSELATRRLRLLPSVHGERAGLVGCAALALDHALAPAAIDARLVATLG